MDSEFNVLYAQSGGATSVINHSARALIESAQHHQDIRKIFAAQNGLQGLIQESLFNCTNLSKEDLDRLSNTPGAFFGSCRLKLPPFDPERVDPLYPRIASVLKAHNIGAVFYNGGNDSQNTTAQLGAYFQHARLNIRAVGIPKTIDNDLACCDVSPGFASAAQFLRLSLQLLDCDLRGMSATSTKVFILEAMGRNSGWVAAGAVSGPSAKHYLLALPEFPLDPLFLLSKIKSTVEAYGRAVLVVSEGVRDLSGAPIGLSANGFQDPFGHKRLGGVAAHLASEVQGLGLPCHYAIPSYLQRSASHFRSSLDLELAEQVSAHAVTHLHEINPQDGGRVVSITYHPDRKTPFTLGLSEALRMADQERKLPPNFFDPKALRLTKEAERYFAPLMQSELSPFSVALGQFDLATPETLGLSPAPPLLELHKVV